MIIGEINLQNSYAVSRFGDHWIHNILKNLQLVERTYNYCKAQMEIVNIALRNAGMADRSNS